MPINRSACISRRGLAEIELVLMMPLIIVLLYLLINTMRLHDARQRAQARAISQTWHAAAENAAALDRPDLEVKYPLAFNLQVSPRPQYVPDGSISLSMLPVDVVIAEATEQASFQLGVRKPFGSVTLRKISAVVSPAWTYIDNLTGTGASMDVQRVRGWYRNLGKYANAGMTSQLKLAGD